MQSEEALWAHVFALVAVQMHMVKGIMSVAPNQEDARKTLFKWEQDTLAMLPKLLPVGRDDAGLTDRLRERSTALIADWFAAFHFSERPGN